MASSQWADPINKSMLDSLLKSGSANCNSLTVSHRLVSLKQDGILSAIFGKIDALMLTDDDPFFDGRKDQPRPSCLELLSVRVQKLF